MEYFLSMNIQSSKTEKELILISVSLLYLLYILYETSIDICRLVLSIIGLSYQLSVCILSNGFSESTIKEFIIYPYGTSTWYVT